MNMVILDSSPPSMETLQARIDELESELGLYRGPFNPQTSILHKIRRATAAYFMVEEDVLLDLNRKSGPNRARQIGIYIARTMTNKSLPEIGRVFQRDHTTVRQAVNAIASRLMRGDKIVQEEIAAITRLIGQDELKSR